MLKILITLLEASLQRPEDTCPELKDFCVEIFNKRKANITVGARDLDYTAPISLAYRDSLYGRRDILHDPSPASAPDPKLSGEYFMQIIKGFWHIGLKSHVYELIRTIDLAHGHNCFNSNRLIVLKLLTSLLGFIKDNDDDDHLKLIAEPVIRTIITECRAGLTKKRPIEPRNWSRPSLSVGNCCAPCVYMSRQVHHRPIPSNRSLHGSWIYPKASHSKAVYPRLRAYYTRPSSWFSYPHSCCHENLQSVSTPVWRMDDIGTRLSCFHRAIQDSAIEGYTWRQICRADID